ncbi:MAG: two-component regulator propeller domain-containing protein, partial [Bacteroidota bacterium]
SQDIGHCITFSDDGVMWIGTNGYGANYLAPRTYPFQQLNLDPDNAFSLSSNYVSSILELEDGTALVGTNRTLDHLSLTTSQTLRRTVIQDPVNGRFQGIKKILPAREPNQYWLATTNGLALYHAKKGTYSWPAYDRTRGRINDLLWYSDHELLIAGRHDLYYWDLRADSLVGLQGTFGGGPEVNNFQTQALTLVGDTLWIGTLQGLIALNWETRHAHQYLYEPDNPHSIPANTIKSIYQDKRENIWICTWGGGLSRYLPEKDQFQTYDIKDGLPNNVVYGMLETENSVFWLGTNGGLVRFDPYGVTRKPYFTFTEEDGVQSNEFNTGAYHQGPSGTFYLGGINGLNWFRPEDIVINRTPPATVITEFYLNNLPLAAGHDGVLPKHILEMDTLRLRWNQNNLAFRVAALDYTTRKENKFRYRLEGYDEEWQGQDNNYIRYTSLEPGRYTLVVQAANTAGYWDEPGRELVIYLHPPLWRYPAFQILAGALGVGLLIGGYFFRLRRLKQGNRKLEIIVAERTRTLQNQQEELATAHEELEQQNDELRLTSGDLEVRNRELREQGLTLTQLKDNLETLVEERTLELMQANQELAQQNSQLEQFAFITAHNLKAPISQFQGLLSILPPKHTFDDYTREVHDRMHRSADELKEVVNDLNLILDIKKGVGREFTHVNLIDHISKVVASLRNEANQKNTLYSYHEKKS